MSEDEAQSLRLKMKGFTLLPQREKEGSKPKDKLAGLVLLAVFVLGLSIMLYPTVSDLWNSRVQSRVIDDYQSAVDELTQTDYSAIFDAADAYNRAIAQLQYPLMYYKQLDENPELLPYSEQLNMRNGIMGYVSIERIDVKLPIYHTTSDVVLNSAVGHLEGTSLPVGGASTHTVLSAHRGLPSAKLFSDLDKLEIGDKFTITVLDRLLTYEVDDISIVTPYEVDGLYVEEGKQYCTLLTCTPYGINSHRLLVRGRQIENEKPQPVIHVPSDGTLVDELIVAPIFMALLLPIVLIIISARTRKTRKGERK